jgi:hypothetical protein
MELLFSTGSGPAQHCGSVFFGVGPQRKHPPLRQPIVALGTDRKESAGLPLLIGQSYSVHVTVSNVSEMVSASIINA